MTALAKLIAQLESTGSAATGKNFLAQVKAEHAALVAVAEHAEHLCSLNPNISNSCNPIIQSLKTSLEALAAVRAKDQP